MTLPRRGPNEQGLNAKRHLIKLSTLPPCLFEENEMHNYDAHKALYLL